MCASSAHQTRGGEAQAKRSEAQAPARMANANRKSANRLTRQSGHAWLYGAALQIPARVQSHATAASQSCRLPGERESRERRAAGGKERKRRNEARSTPEADSFELPVLSRHSHRH